MYRVPRGEFNRTETDETTDAWDTIDWLVKNVAGHNGRVGVWALEADVAAIEASYHPSTEPLELLAIRPKRAGVQVQLVALAWR